MNIALSLEDARIIVRVLRIDINRLLGEPCPWPGLAARRQKSIAQELDLKHRIEKEFALTSRTLTPP